MKKFLLAFAILSVVIGCKVRNKNENGAVTSLANGVPVTDSTQVQLIDSVFNFGKITEGENVSFSFRFKNVGNKPLVISAANASCGCTVPEKPEAPIKPGEIGYLKVAFNSLGREGEVYKQVDVISNASPKFPILYLKGEIVLAQK